MTDARTIAAAFQEAADNFVKLQEQAPLVAEAADMLIECLKAGGKVMFCGNGGSASDSQHLSAELIGRYMRDRPALPALALSVDTSALTAIANDYGYDHVFARQVQGLGQRGDVLVGLSTSGNSPNVLNALEAAREKGIRTLGLTGAGGGRMADACDLCIKVPATRTNSIQEMHIAVGHLLCAMVEDALF